jgi:HSP20 family molecular chaperone IbpA
MEACAGVLRAPPHASLSMRRPPVVSRPSLFGSPLFLGFDHLEQMLDRVAKNADGYPPYNIEQTGENRLRITLAVAGFSMDDLQITQEDNQLVIRGRQKDEPEGRIFLHRGIAARQFQRAFVLAEGIEVEGAWLDNGLLHVDLRRPQPEVRVKTIQIASKGNGAAKTPVVDGRADKR